MSRWRAYHVPVLNRLSTANFSFLWENAQDTLQVINVGCIHAGLKMVFKKHPTALIFGVDQNQAAAIGLILSLIAVLFFVPSQWSVYAAFGLGVCVKLVGIGAIKSWDFILRTMS